MRKAMIIGLSVILFSLGIAQAEASHAELDKLEARIHEFQQLSNPQLKPSSLHSDAFHQSLQSALPLTPEQILTLRKQFNQTQAAMAAHPDVPPKPVQPYHQLDLSPGSTPMVIRLAQGYLTALVFLDSTHQPWPVESYTIGDPQAFSVQWDKKSNVIMLQANTLYSSGNIAVMLKTLNVPIMLTLLPGQPAVDYSLEIRVPGEGPNAKQFIGRSLPEQLSTDLLSVLDGVPPAGSQSLRVIGGDGNTRAWLSGKRFYLRTHLTILSPAWLSMVSSADGTHAYELPRFSSILASYKGETVALKIEEL
jgi:intracellular multiplication protein IcmK